MDAGEHITDEVTAGDGTAIVLPDIPDFASPEAVKLWLSERSARETEPRCILGITAAAIGRYLRAARVGYGEFERGRDWVDIPLDWTRAGVPSIAGRHALDPDSMMVARYRRGSVVVVDDTAGRDAVPDPAQLLVQNSNRAFITIPLIHDGARI